MEDMTDKALNWIGQQKLYARQALLLYFGQARPTPRTMSPRMGR